jgi:hypothetical protein
MVQPEQERQCVHCGTRFRARWQRHRGRYAVFCSQSCISQQPRQRRCTTSPGVRQTATCPIDGTVFQARWMYRLKRYQRYCSRACRDIGATGPHISRACANSGCPNTIHRAAWYGTPRAVRRGHRVRYCSTACYMAVRWGDKPARIVSAMGYVFVKAPLSYANGGRRIQEHRLVMEQLLGRRLVPGETVHHKNGDRADNRPDNLELWTRAQPAGHHDRYAAELVAARIEIARLTTPRITEASWPAYAEPANGRSA